MNKSDLTEALSKDTGLPIRKAEEAVKAILIAWRTPLQMVTGLRSGTLGFLRLNTMMDIPGTTPKQANLSRSSPRSCPFSNAAKNSKRW